MDTTTEIIRRIAAIERRLDVLATTEHTNSSIGGSWHSPVTLDANADTLLSITGQALGLDVQAAGAALMGPASGAPAPPAFRAIDTADISPLTGDLDFAKFKAVAMCADNGTTFPASPATGQWYYRTDVDVLYMYEGAWKPIVGFSNFSLYVDTASGSDAVEQGFSSGAGATKTIAYAFGLVPRLALGVITINIAAGTYAENLTLPTVLGGGYLYIVGAYTEVASGTTTGTYIGGGSSTTLTWTTQTGTISTVGSSTTVTIGGGGDTTNCYPGQVIFAGTNVALAGIIVSVDSSTQVTIDRAVDFSAGYTWALAGATYIDSAASWADGAYDGYWFVDDRTGTATTDATHAWPIIATCSGKKSITVGARPYSYTASSKAYSIVRLDTVIQGTLSVAFLGYPTLYWLRIEPTSASQVVVVATRRGLGAYCCKFVSPSSSAYLMYVYGWGSLSTVGCWFTGPTLIGIFTFQLGATNLSNSLIDLTSNHASYQAISTDMKGMTYLNSCWCRCRVSNRYVDTLGLSLLRITTVSVFVLVSGSSSVAAITMRGGSNTSNAAAQQYGFYGFATTWDIQTQTAGNTDYFPLVQIYPEATAAPSAGTDQVKVYAANQAGEAGNEALHILSEADKTLKFGNRLAHSGGRQIHIASKTGNYTATVADRVILCDASGGAFTVTLPAAASAWDSALAAGTVLTVKKTDSSANAVTVDGNGSETIDGATTVSLSAQWQRVTIISNGSAWYVID